VATRYNLEADIAVVAQEVDQACAALIKDLKQRGMFDDTLIVWGGRIRPHPDHRRFTTQTSDANERLLAEPCANNSCLTARDQELIPKWPATLSAGARGGTAPSDIRVRFKKRWTNVFIEATRG